MKAILVMFDTLCRHYLSPYGCDWTHTPGFQRLAEHSVVFDNNYVGSLPCIPARRELHTGRYNFLHRSWGPLEPYDVSMPRILSENGVYTHIATDHMHYFEEGGATYHQRYNSWEVSRGEEGDPWKADVKWMQQLTDPFGKYVHQDIFNRTLIVEEQDYPQAKTFRKGLDFLERNRDADNWFLTIEAFDPHEPYQVPERYKDHYRHLQKGDWDIWPDYGKLKEGDVGCRYTYAALVSMCDHRLGLVLDFMDRHNMWDDTMLILCTDHGYLLGEHGGLGKVPLPGYREVCNTPLMIWDPISRKTGRNSRLVQTVDIAPTLLDFFGAGIPSQMLGHSLLPVIREGVTIREAALLGVHSLYTCCTDGRYMYMRAPDPSVQIYNYTLMPTHMHGFFSLEELRKAQLAETFPFTDGIPLLRVPAGNWSGFPYPKVHMLFDMKEDPEQNAPVDEPEIAKRMLVLMERIMRENDAPEEYYSFLRMR